jgi:signal transduction histidine kinase
MPDGGKLRIVTEQQEAGWVRISFADEGPGIDEEAAGKLFEPFFTTKDGGTGLGLAIANRIILAHGGTIEFENRKHGGAEFVLVLPVGRDKQAARSGGAQNDPKAAAPAIT